MILSSTRPDQFKFDLPVDILPDDIAETYNSVFVHQPAQIVTNMHDLLHDCVSKITIQGLNGPITQQAMKISVDDNGVPHNSYQFQRGAANVESTIDKRITIKMRLVMGGINYFALMESYFRYWNDKSTEMFFQPMYFTSLYNKRPIFKVVFKNVVWASMSGLDYDATMTDRTEQSFDLTFVYNSIQMLQPADILKQ